MLKSIRLLSNLAIVLSLLTIALSLGVIHAELVSAQAAPAWSSEQAQAYAENYGLTQDAFQLWVEDLINGGPELAGGVFYLRQDSVFKIDFEAYDRSNCENAFDLDRQLSLPDPTTGEPVYFVVAFQGQTLDRGFVNGFMAATDDPGTGFCWIEFTFVGPVGQV